MAKIIVNTTFRDFTGDINDKMQINFLKSLRRQTMQDFMLVVTIFGERNVEKTVKSILGNKCVFVYDEMENHYKFSLSKTFMNGVDYGLKNHADILLDCSSDIVLQRNFLEVVEKRSGAHSAGISHPNIYMNVTETGQRIYEYGKLGGINGGIDVRYFSLDLFEDEHVYNLVKKYPSYDYGAGIEMELCCIGIKYAKKRYNIFPESKVLKIENDRGGVRGKINAFVREGLRRNEPTVRHFLRSEGLSLDYMDIRKVNRQYKASKNLLKYNLYFIGKDMRQK